MIRLKTLFILGCKRFTEKSSCKGLTPKYYCLKNRCFLAKANAYNESKIISRDVLSLIDLFQANAKPDEASLEVELQVFRNHCLASKQGIATINDALNYCSKFKELFPLTLRC